MYSFNSPHTSEASHLSPTVDWAWSSNIGWISFNCNNGGIGDTCGVSNYKVHAEDVSAGEARLRGHAWSSNIGWISFEPNDLVNCPAGLCEARLSTSELTGWARVLSTGEWISLNCANMGTCGTPQNANYKVSYDIVSGNLSGWAWGSGVVGWISFSCNDTGTCGVSPYQVRIQPTPEESCQDISAVNFGGPLPCEYPPSATTTPPGFDIIETIPR